jgi:hypothetical protein
MARTGDVLGGTGDDPKIKVKGPKTPKTKKGKGKGKGKKAKKAKVKHAPKPGRWHAASGAAAAAGHAPSASKETGAVIHPAGKGMAPLQLTPNADSRQGMTAGLGGIILDLVGEGTVRLSSALAAWARESERITNRSWRRPGGLSALGGL